jgi:hypothetical protein
MFSFPYLLHFRNQALVFFGIGSTDKSAIDGLYREELFDENSDLVRVLFREELAIATLRF